MLEPVACKFCNGYDTARVIHVLERKNWYVLCIRCRHSGARAIHEDLAIIEWNIENEQRKEEIV